MLLFSGVARQEAVSAKLLSGNTFSQTLFDSRSGKGIKTASPGIPRPDFPLFATLRSGNLSPASAKNSVTGLNFLNADAGARNLPLRFDSTHLAGAVRANPHQLRWRGLARSSCELVRVNSFFSPSLPRRRAGQVDRIEAAR